MEHALLIFLCCSSCYHWLVALLIVFRALVVDMLEASGAVLVAVMRWVGGWFVEMKCQSVFCVPVCVFCVPVIVLECMWSVRELAESERDLSLSGPYNECAGNHLFYSEY